MLTFDVSVSGAQVGKALAHDLEELAYALVEVMDCINGDIGAQLVDLGPAGLASSLPDWLRKLADQIEAA